MTNAARNIKYRAVGHSVLNSSLNVLELSGSRREAPTKPRSAVSWGVCHDAVVLGDSMLPKLLKHLPVQITLIDKRNFHLFQPLLYQVATGSLSPADISSPLRLILRHHQNTRVLLDEVTDVEPQNKQVILKDHEPIPYDLLVIATGVSHHYFGNDQWQPLAPGLKTIEDAIEIRRRIFLAFEAAEKESDPEQREAWLTFAIVGGGPTGVELAGAIAEIAHSSLRGDFRTIDTSRAKISAH
jgi:NADH dehydrogenase